MPWQQVTQLGINDYAYCLYLSINLWYVWFKCKKFVQYSINYLIFALTFDFFTLSWGFLLGNNLDAEYRRAARALLPRRFYGMYQRMRRRLIMCACVCCQHTRVAFCSWSTIHRLSNGAKVFLDRATCKIIIHIRTSLVLVLLRNPHANC